MNEQTENISAASTPAHTASARSLAGTVASSKMNKTITVLVERRVMHALYKKFVLRSTKVHAHDENNECRVGDTVLLEECRPLSKTKSWRMVKILQRGE